MTGRDWGTSGVLLADMLAALGVVVLAWLYLGLGTEGFLLLTGITLVLALTVGLLLRAAHTTPKGTPS